MLEYFDLEYAVCGDGEAVMLEFVERIENRKPLEGLKGLIIRRENIIIQDNEPFRVDVLDALPFPKPQRYLNLDRYRRLGSPLQVHPKRGYALSCSYCTYNKIEGYQYRLKNPGRIAGEIEILVKETGFNHIEFADSIFNIPLAHAKNVLREIIRKKLKLRLHTMRLSPVAVDEELLKIPGWLLVIGNFILKVCNSSQPVWRLLILLNEIERALGIGLVKRSLYDRKMRTSDKKSRISNGFSLLRDK